MTCGNDKQQVVEKSFLSPFDSLVSRITSNRRVGSAHHPTQLPPPNRKHFLQIPSYTEIHLLELL